jgi:MFS family permease
MFATSVGYGFLLPILPRILERVASTTDPAVLSRHTGLLTGTYTLALFLFAPLWGRFADRHGRRPALLSGLVGFAISLLLIAVVDDLALLYLERLLGGLFAAAVAPAAYAFVGDHAPSKEWRAHRFALLNIAGATGFLVGPMLGGLTMHVVHDLLPGLRSAAMYWPPFFVTAGFALLVALAVWTCVPGANRRNAGLNGTADAPAGRAALPRLLLISFVTAGAVGVFEVGLSLRGTQILGMSTYQIGLMFTECSLVMLIVQSAVFSPLVKPDTTRWLLAPALAILAGGLAVVPFATSTVAMAIAVAIVAGSAGVVSPIAIYWISLGAGEKQGADLGQQTAAASLGQALGSAAGGLLFSVTILPNASFMLAATAVVAGLAASISVPRLLRQTGYKKTGDRYRATLTDAGLPVDATRQRPKRR